MKNSGIEWIGNIPDNWGTLPLKRMIDKHYGGCWGEDAQNNQNDVLCIRIADFNFDNQTIKENTETMRNYTDAQIEKGLLQDGDLIVEKSGGGDKTPVGRVVIFDKKQFPQRAMFANFSECLRLKNAYSQRYIAYHLKSLYYSYDMHYYFHQTTGIQNLDMQEYLATVLCVPSVEQQKAVVETLDEKCGKIDELIANQQAQIEKLKEYKQSVITEAVTKGLDKNAPMKDSNIEWIGEIPAHWELFRGKVLFRQRNEKGNDVCLQLLSPTQRYGVIPQEMYDELSGMTAVKLNINTDLSTMKTIRKGDYCISLRSFQGGFEYSKYEGVVSPAYQVFYAIRELDEGYYKYLFKENGFISEMNSYTLTIRDGKNIAYADFANSYIPYPPLSIQKEIFQRLDKLSEQIDRLIAIKQEKIEKLQEYKKSLIYEYVTGKKEIV